MLKHATLAILITVVMSAPLARAGEMIIRETETGVYVELTGEKPAAPAKTEEEIAAERKDAQDAADKERRMQQYAKQKARLDARRLKAPAEEGAE